MRLRRGRDLALAAALLVQPAAAHELIPGLTGFPAQVLHPLLLMDHMLALLAAGLIAGQNGVRLVRVLLAFFPAMLAGYLFPSTGIPVPYSVFLPLVLALLCGGLIAASLRLPAAAAMALVAVVGFAVGYATTPEQGGLRAAVETIGGAMLGSLALLLLAAALAMRADRDWQRIGVRVAGSWIAAGTLMVLALLFVG
jgi:hydrogenase/urease accessory protein HupE